MVEEIEYRPYTMSEEDDWAQGWELRKTKMIRKIRQKKDLWYKVTTDEKTEKRWAEEVVKAARERRRAKGLKKITPDEWVSQVESGVTAKTITDEEKRKWAERSAPYRDLVKYLSRLMKELGIRGELAMECWKRINFEILKPARKRPELIPQLRPKAEAIIHEYARRVPTTVEIKI